MNDSNTELIAQDQTIISFNDSLNEGDIDQNSSISVPEASIQITLSLQTQEHNNETSE